MRASPVVQRRGRAAACVRACWRWWWWCRTSACCVRRQRGRGGALPLGAGGRRRRIGRSRGALEGRRGHGRSAQTAALGLGRGGRRARRAGAAGGCAWRAAMRRRAARCWRRRRWSNRFRSALRAIALKLPCCAACVSPCSLAAAGGAGPARARRSAPCWSASRSWSTSPPSLWLQAPRNDVMLMRQALQKQGFAAGDITVLADGVGGAALPEAQRIHEALARLLAQSTERRFRAAVLLRPRHALRDSHQALPGARWPGRELSGARRARRGRRRRRAAPAACAMSTSTAGCRPSWRATCSSGRCSTPAPPPR